MSSKALIIFIKNPVLGRVKTRLAKQIGDKRALAAYKHLITYTKKLCKDIPYHQYIFYSHHIDRKDAWDGKQIYKKLQSGNDLGTRMHHAFDQILKKHSQVVLIGSDCGVLTKDQIQKAFASLSTYDVVIGPTEDGGYYLLGLTKLIPELFEGISWGTAKVYNQTLTKMQSQQPPIKIRVLDQLFDIDYLEDWNRLGWGKPLDS